MILKIEKGVPAATIGTAIYERMGVDHTRNLNLDTVEASVVTPALDSSKDWIPVLGSGREYESGKVEVTYGNILLNTAKEDADKVRIKYMLVHDRKGNATYLQADTGNAFGVQTLMALSRAFGAYISVNNDGNYKEMPLDGRNEMMVAEVKGMVEPADIEDLVYNMCDVSPMGQNISVRELWVPKDLQDAEFQTWFKNPVKYQVYEQFVKEGKLQLYVPGKKDNNIHEMSYKYASAKYEKNEDLSKEQVDIICNRTTTLSMPAYSTANKAILMALLEAYGGWFCENSDTSDYIEIKKNPRADRKPICCDSSGLA